MADVMTWINVADSAVKIGLGALLGGGFGVWVAWLNNKSQSRKAYFDRRRAILENVLESVDGAINAASIFWAKLADAAYKKDKSLRISDAEHAKLDELQSNFFAAFTVLNSSSAKLLLLGEETSDAKLDQLRTTFNAFFKISDLNNSGCTGDTLDKHKAAMSAARKGFYLELSASYRRDS